MPSRSEWATCSSPLRYRTQGAVGRSDHDAVRDSVSSSDLPDDGRGSDGPGSEPKPARGISAEAKDRLAALPSLEAIVQATARGADRVEAAIEGEEYDVVADRSEVLELRGMIRELCAAEDTSSIMRAWFEAVLRIWDDETLRLSTSAKPADQKLAIRRIADTVGEARREREERADVATLERNVGPRLYEQLLSMFPREHLAFAARFFEIAHREMPDGAESEHVEALEHLVSDMLLRMFEDALLRGSSVLGGRIGGGERRPTRLRWILDVVRRDRGCAPDADELVRQLDGYDGFDHVRERVWPEIDHLGVADGQLLARAADGEVIQRWALRTVVERAREVGALQRASTGGPERSRP
jgi:hypothetical protein